MPAVRRTTLGTQCHICMHTRGLLSTTASLMSDLLTSPNALKGVDTNHLKMLLESARDSHNPSVVAIDEELITFSTHIQLLLDEPVGRSRPSKLWVQYIRLAGLLKLFMISTWTANFAFVQRK